MSDLLHPDEQELPVLSILEVLQSSNNPELQKLTNEQWYEVENSLNKPVYLRRLPRYVPAVIRPSDREFELTFHIPRVQAQGKFEEAGPRGFAILRDGYWYQSNQDADLCQRMIYEGKAQLEGKRQESVSFKRTYFVRYLEFADCLEIASIGPQIIETFFNGDLDSVAAMSLDAITEKVVAKSLAKRVQLCMNDLAEAVLIKLCELMVDENTREPLSYNDLFRVDPMEATNAIQSALAVNRLFFSYLAKHIPENIKGVLHYLAGTISGIGNPIVTALGTEILNQASEQS